MTIEELKQSLLKDQSKENRDHIAQWVGKDLKRMDMLVELFLSNNYRVSQRASWPLLFVGIKNPLQIRVYEEAMLAATTQSKHDAVIRNVFRLFQEIEISDELEGQWYETCFDYFSNPNSAIAIRVFAMTILSKIALKHSELKEELINEIEFQMPHGSSGFRARGRKLLKSLRK